MESAYSTVDQQLVEAALVEYYLRSDGPFGAGALRSIDASPAQLATALNLEVGQDPVKELARACGGAWAMSYALAYGTGFLTDAVNVPGFFRYLIMTCAVVAGAERNGGTHEFGESLAIAFDSPNVFTRREALPRLWRDLQTWCNARRDAGAPIRKLVLPSSGAWKYVGITHAITFPGWRDVQRLKAIVDEYRWYSPIDSPKTAAQVMCPKIKWDSRFSPAMREASEEYERLYLAKASLLGLHRFWLAVRHTLEAERRPAKPEPIFPQLRLRFGFDIEDVELRAGVVNTNGDTLENEMLEACVDDVLHGFPAWLLDHDLSITGAALLTAVNAGLVPFLEEEFGLWVSTLNAPEAPTRCVVLLAKGKKHLAKRWFADGIAIGENWLLVGPLPAREARSVYQDLADIVHAPPLPPPTALRVSGGCKTGGGYLGRPSLLPWLTTYGPGSVSCRPDSGRSVVPHVNRDVAGSWRIESTHALDGLYSFVLEERLLPDIEPLAIETTLPFFSNALEHVALADIDSAQWRVAQEARFNLEPVTRSLTVASLGDAEVGVEGHLNAAFDDFLEALYAGGRSGWGEQDLLSMMREVLGSDAPSPWDILRGLAEADWLRETSNVRWRSRRWWLQKPKIVKFTCADGTGALLLRGSTPAAVRARFMETASASGCAVHTRRGVGDYSSISMVATGEQLRAVIEELDWPVAEASSVAMSAAPDCWPQESADESRHSIVARWIWDQGTFDARVTQSAGGITVERYRRERGDREDLFVVSEEAGDRKYVTTSRVVAVAEAYRRMGIPFFAYAGGLLVRIPREGYLIRELAWEAAIRGGRNPGPAFVNGDWTYAYPADEYMVCKLRKTFGARFVEAQTPEVNGGELKWDPNAFGLLRHRNASRVDGRYFATGATARN